MNDEGNWFKINRNIVKQEWFQDSIMVHIVVELLCNANWQDNKYKIGNNQVNIKRGQYPHGIRHIGRQTGLHHTTVSRKIDYLKQDGFLTSETVHGRIVITICNYATYQDNKKESGSVGSQPVASNAPASSQQVATTEESKESKEREEGKQQHTQIADVEKESIIEKDRKRLMDENIDSPEELIAYWYKILNCFGVEKPHNIDPNASKREWASSNDMLKYRLVDINGLKASIYSLAYDMLQHASYKDRYQLKNCSNVLLDLSYVCRILRKRKIVGWAKEEPTEQVVDNPWR